jgi:adenine-specific DNA-methyltransferase
VLDLFAGSASLAHATLVQNLSDSGSRKVISIQLPEPVKEDSEASSLGYKTISDIARHRIVAATRALSVKVESGFRSYSLGDTYFSKWRVSSEVDRNELEQHLFNLRESASNEATPNDLLTEVLLKQGYSLTEQIAEARISGLDCYVVGKSLVIAYLDEKVKPTLDQLRAMVDQDPQRIIILEDAFQGADELKTNLAQLCKSKGIELWTA